MHPALEVQDVLLNIFSHCFGPGLVGDASCLAILARTCRTFKEPALDFLWEDLYTFSPLFRCLPEASRELSQGKSKQYSFIRPLTETEWDTLRSYTRRIRSLQDFSITLNDKTFLSPPTAEPLFPRLRSLGCKYETDTILLSQLPIPSLGSLRLYCDVLLLRDNLQSLPTLSPNISSLSIALTKWQNPFDCKVEPNYFSQWKNLDSLICNDLVLDMNCVVLLSRVSTLTRLSFTLLNTPPASCPILHFENLQELSLHCYSFPLLSTVLPQIELPAVTDLSVHVGRPTVDQALGPIFSLVQTAKVPHTIKKLSFFWGLISSGRAYGDPLVVLDDLRPCMTFRHLCCLRVDLESVISLTDDDLLTLVSVWPRLEEISLNETWGWGAGGITPNGLLRLLQTHQTLNRVALAIDTRVEIPQVPENFGSALPGRFSMNVVDSRIPPEAVPGMSAFFAGFASGCEFSLVAWNSRNMMDDEEWEVQRRLWNEVYNF